MLGDLLTNKHKSDYIFMFIIGDILYMYSKVFGVLITFIDNLQYIHTSPLCCFQIIHIMLMIFEWSSNNPTINSS